MFLLLGKATLEKALPGLAFILEQITSIPLLRPILFKYLVLRLENIKPVNSFLYFAMKLIEASFYYLKLFTLSCGMTMKILIYLNFILSSLQHYCKCFATVIKLLYIIVNYMLFVYLIYFQMHTKQPPPMKAITSAGKFIVHIGSQTFICHP